MTQLTSGPSRPSRSPRVAAAALVLAIVVVPGPAGAQPHRTPDHWIATWATAPVARVPPAAPGGAPAAPGATAIPGAGAPAAPPRPPFFPNNQTLRQIVHISLGGERLRVVLTNTFGSAPLSIGAARVALRQNGSALVPGSDRLLTFSGGAATSIPAGAVMVSDPVALSVPNFADLAIDLYIPDDTSKTTVTGHAGAFETNYASAPGNHAGEADLPDATTNTSWYFLGRVEVSAPEHTPVVVALGDSITDGTASTVDGNKRWPDVLARRLMPAKGSRKIAVVNAGIAGNRLLSQAPGTAGINILARFDHDVLTQPGAEYVVVLEAINDIGLARQNPTPGAADLIAAARQLIARAHAQGLKIYGGTLTPFEGAAYWTAEGETKREAVNEWIRTAKEYDGVIDFDAAVHDPQHPTKYLPQYESRDHLHPSDAGYEAMGDAINLAMFK
jgi:lysophospholipase L1-like esterase